MPDRPTLVGIGLISASSLALELCLTRIFSVTLFYHFAFLVVSMALFGIGAAGMWIYLRQRAYPTDKLPRALAFHAAGFGLATVVALCVVLGAEVPKEFGSQALWDLAAVFSVAALPFFFSGMVLSLAVTVLKEQVSRVYAWDLVGAALGCLLVIPALDLLGGPSAVLGAGALGASAAALFGPASRLRRTLVSAPAVGLWILVIVDLATGLFTIPSAKATREEAVVYAAWNSFSRVTVSDTREPLKWIHIDSDAATAIFEGSDLNRAAAFAGRFNEARMASLVYTLTPGGHALIIGPGGGADVVGALSRGVARVTGVELNPIIVGDIMGDRFADFSGHLYARPNVEVVVGEGRSFVRGADQKYDVIQATLVDTWAATSAGAFTLSENNLYTLEAFADFLDHLNKPDGILTMTRWMRTPPREFARLVSLGVAALEARGVKERRWHFFIAGDQRAATFLLRVAPFSENELSALRARCERDRLRVIYDPARPGTDLLARLITSPDPAAIWNAHPLDISPPTDDRPFFFYTSRPADFWPKLFDWSQGAEGVRTLASLLVLVGLAVLLVLVLPLPLFARADLAGHAGRKLTGLVYFLAIGVGFIGLELSWMQHFILFLGHPVYALGVVLFVLLLASGLGARLTAGVEPARALPNIWRTVAMLAGLVVIYGLLLGPLFRIAVGWPLWIKIPMAAVLLGPAGLLMGRMLPLGIKVLTPTDPTVVPWAWAVNGAGSVFGSVVAVALSMNLGFSSTQLVASAAYLLGCAALWLAYRRATPQAVLTAPVPSGKQRGAEPTPTGSAPA